jgi:predicted protein tyrosine phosphatase
VFLPLLNRKLAVQSRKGVEDMMQYEPGFWNVISISQPKYPPAQLRGAKEACFLVFDDVSDPFVYPTSAGWKHYTPQHWALTRDFVRRTAPGPLLIHCIEGRSRSTGIAFVLLLLALPQVHKIPPSALTDDHLREAWRILKTVRPIAEPNAIVVRTALTVEWGERLAEEIIARLSNVINEPLDS